MSEKSRVEKKSLVKKSIGQQFVKRKIIENTQSLPQLNLT